MYELRYTPAAERDLLAIAEYLERERGQAFAQRYLSAMKMRIGMLRDNAHTFRERSELGPGRRAINFKPYLVFYRLIGNTVYVQRVLHGARRITPRLLGEP